MPKTFRFQFYVENVVLSVDQLWPNGAPENPTVSDVEKLIEDCGGAARVIDDWNLIDDIMIDVLEEPIETCC